MHRRAVQFGVTSATAAAAAVQGLKSQFAAAAAATMPGERAWLAGLRWKRRGATFVAFGYDHRLRRRSA